MTHIDREVLAGRSGCAAPHGSDGKVLCGVAVISDQPWEVKTLYWGLPKGAARPRYETYWDAWKEACRLNQRETAPALCVDRLGEVT